MSQLSDPTAPSTRRRPVLDFLRARVRRYLERHQLPINLRLHIVGVPLAFLSLAACFLVTPWFWGAAGFCLGYLLQYIGHRLEGNDVGEWAAIKALLGLPYVAVAPRWQKAEEAKDG